MTVVKPKRKLSDIDFSKEGAHIALCHKDQSVANGADFQLVVKSEKFSDEFIEKIQQVKVTLELPEFLTRFFCLWEDDAEILAYMMGYVEPAETAADEKMEAEEDFQDWIKERMESFEILKAAKEADNLSDVLSALDEHQYLALLQDQETIEKAMKKQRSKAKSKSKTTRAFAGDTSVGNPAFAVVAASANPATATVVKAENQQENPMTQEVFVEQELQTEMIAKSAYEDLQKSLNEQKEQLEKALATVAQFEAERKEAIAKARKATIQAAVKDEAKAETLFKALVSLADVEFDSTVEVIKSLANQVEQSALFVEQGATVEEFTDVQKESAVSQLLKARFQTK